MGESEVVGRFAPSPTGPLHEGSVVAALGSFLFARSRGGRWLLRIDDLDTPRVVSGIEDDILRTLETLGLWWDGEIVRQSRRTDAYREAFERLGEGGYVYPCGCSRSEIARVATAPHDGEGELIYPGSCSGGMLPGKPVRSWRVRVPDAAITFDDLVRGRKSYRLPDVCGDFVIRRGDGIFSYQLATVVDDHFQGVTQVVRGEDLLSSTPRQIHLFRLLGYDPPVYGHLPLVTAPDGGKLSKRDSVVSAGRFDGRGEASRILVRAARFLGFVVPQPLEGALPDEIVAHCLRQMTVSPPARLLPSSS